MATLNVPPGYAQVVMKFTGPTRTGTAITTMGFQDTEAVSLGGIPDLVSAKWATSFANDQHEAFSLVQVDAYDNFNIGTGSYSIPGEMTGDLAPPQVSTLLRKSSPLRGHKYKGRCFLPGLLNDNQIYDDGTIATGKYALLEADVEAFFGSLAVDDGLVPFLFHPGTEVPTDITLLTIDSKIATQRRRLR